MRLLRLRVPVVSSRHVALGEKSRFALGAAGLAAVVGGAPPPRRETKGQNVEVVIEVDDDRGVPAGGLGMQHPHLLRVRVRVRVIVWVRVRVRARARVRIRVRARVRVRARARARVTNPNPNPNPNPHLLERLRPLAVWPLVPRVHPFIGTPLMHRAHPAVRKLIRGPLSIDRRKRGLLSGPQAAIQRLLWSTNRVTVPLRCMPLEELVLIQAGLVHVGLVATWVRVRGRGLGSGSGSGSGSGWGWGWGWGWGSGWG